MAFRRRWLTSVFVHQSFSHLLSNLLLLIALGWQVEKKYGTWRIALLFWFAAIGGVPTLGHFSSPPSHGSARKGHAISNAYSVVQ